MKPVLVFFVTISLVFGAPHKDINDRIIGGDDGDIADFPYVLQIEYDDELLCGAILVSTNFALTAAHCVVSKYAERLIIRAGATTLYEDGQELFVEKVSYHPKYDSWNNSYDAALLHLSTNVSVLNAEPIKLAENDDAIVEGVNITVMGWGWLDFTYYAEYSSTLQVIELPIISDEDCLNAYPIVNNVMFCVAYLEHEGRGYCLGDNGGPAVIDGVLVGIMSFGQGCGDGTHASVLIRASWVKEWVESIIGT